jgi:SAM-dependent methyltransferase
MEDAVARLYDTFPFPPDPILEEAPPGYNWRWCWQSAYGFCTGGLAPNKDNPRILDAGCGSGVSTEYLAHLNPHAHIVAIDISRGTLEVAQTRIRKTVPPYRSITFHQLSLFELEQIEGEFDLINSVGVIHHTPDPVKALQCLAHKLAPGGIMHIFVYAHIGRWEIRLMQEAIELLGQGAGIPTTDLQRRVSLGRQIFASLPPDNRLVQREQNRWALENQRDECFADMYLHPLEVNFTIDSLFQMIDQSGLEFAGFSNPTVWQLDKLLGSNPELMQYAQQLSPRQRYRLIELLNTDIAHYEFFLYRPPLAHLPIDSDQALLNGIPLRQPCLQGWESQVLFDPDYQVVHLTDLEYEFMRQCDGNRSIQALCAEGNYDLGMVRGLLAKRLILIKF